MKRKNNYLGLALLSCLSSWALSNGARAQHATEQHQLEEVFITGDRVSSAAETAMPLDALSGENLRRAVAASLGQTLAGQPGITSASFGAGVGLPVIRGQSGARVQVLQNGLGALDAASVSPDHANSIDPLIAERIEIIRGPATLLYGNGAIGGVVNVIDNRIPDHLPDAVTGALEVRHNTAASENSAAFKLENSSGQLAWHLDGALRDSGNTEIPGHASTDEAEEDDLGGHEHDHAHEEHHEPSADFGIIPNSDSRSRSLAAGVSRVGSRGFAGFSVSHLTNEYGLPPGTHAHAEEESSGHEEEVHEHAEEDIRIDLQQTRYTVKAGLDTSGFFNRFNARAAYNDYEHTEFAEHQDHDGELHSTRFSNRGFETRLTAEHSQSALKDALYDEWSGVIGLQVGGTEFAVTGEEGFLPRTDKNSVGLFALQSVSAGSWIYEVGARLEQVELSPAGGCGRDDTTWSASAAAIWQLADSVNTSLSVGRAQRAPSVEERYSNVNTASCAPAEIPQRRLHNPTGLIETGNPDLDKETSNNIELSLHKHLGDVHGEISVYFNRINNYIYLAETGQHRDEAPLATYRQEDAEFYGYEAEIHLPVQLTQRRQMEVTLFSDGVHAELVSGEYVPRIPPLRAGIELALLDEIWEVSLRAMHVAGADNLAPGETPSASYTQLELNADYHLNWNGRDLLLFVKGSNLLNETIRNHTSFVKELAPEPGRGIKAGMRFSF